MEKIKVTITKEDGEELDKGEYEGVVFIGITEVGEDSYGIQRVMQKIKGYQLYSMVDDICKDHPEIKAALLAEWFMEKEALCNG